MTMRHINIWSVGGHTESNRLMKSLYESAFSYITKQIDKRISAINDEKDANISALEAERDARLEAIEVQKEQLENEIDGIEKQIKVKEKEIKAIQDANEERKQSIDLQKAEYDLARMQNQKTSFVIKGNQGVYEHDTTGIRDAREEVTDKKNEINISNIEKEIDLLNDQKDILQDQIDLLDKQADQINKYYDNLIAQTEAHYDSMVKGLEDTKSKFEELSDVFENAQMEATLKELGINMDALLAGSEEEFEKLKTAYIGILADISRGNDDVMSQLSRLGGASAESVSYLESTKGAFENLGETTLGTLPEEVETVAESTGNLSTSASEASTAVDTVNTSVSSATANLTPFNDKLTELKTLIDELVTLFSSFTFPEIGDEGYTAKLNAIADAFENIANKCKELQSIDFSSVIGAGVSAEAPDAAGGETAQSGFMGLASAIQSAVSIIDIQMQNLKLALQTGDTAFDDQIAIIEEEYIPAWEKLQERLAEIIGVGGGGDGTDKDGKSKDKKSKDSETGADGSIIGIMQTGGEEVSAKLEDPWLKSFNDFATGENSVQTICELIKQIVDDMASSIQEQCAAAAQALSDLANSALNSSISVGTGSSFIGKAHAKGSDGLPSSEKNAMVGDGAPELVCDPVTGQYSLFTQPTITDLNKGTIIYNGKQTEDILKRSGEKGIDVKGMAFREGTVVRSNGDVLLPLDMNDSKYAWMTAFEKMLATSEDMWMKPTNAMFEAADATKELVKNISNNNNYMNSKVEVNMGDIVLQNVQDVNSFSRELVLRFPNMVRQELHKM